MLQNIAELYGRKLGAIDGAIGHVKDFYFDDHTWAIRYVIADTEPWLSKRLVLLPPDSFGTNAFGEIAADGGAMQVKLTRKQIEESPPIDSHRPVSRQYEEDYYSYYGWPGYWDAESKSGGMNVTAIMPPTPDSQRRHGHSRGDDVHLRSMKKVTGYALHATDGLIGTVSSFMVHGHSWGIRELVVETGHWYAGKTILIVTDNVIRISYENSTVSVNLTRDNIRQTTRNDVAQAGAVSQ